MDVQGHEPVHDEASPTPPHGGDQVRDPAEGHAVAFVDELADGLLQAHDRHSAR